MTTQHSRNGRTRIVITGMGAITPLGLDVETTYQALIESSSGVSLLPLLDVPDAPTKIGATVKGYDGAKYMDPRDARRYAPFASYAVAAATQAVDDAALEIAAEDPTRVGVDIGTALGAVVLIEEQRMTMEKRGPRSVNPLMIPTGLVTTPSCLVAVKYGIKGPVYATVAACATGVVVIGEAAKRLAWGDADVFIVGGSDSVMSVMCVTGFSAPEKACAPFAANRTGAVAGEGSAMVVVETLEHAQRRGARILAEVLGYGLTSDGFHMAAPDPDAAQAARSMSLAIRDAGIAPEELDWIGAHGTGTQLNDVAETKAIKMALGDAAYKTPASSIKSAMGHLFGGAATISAIMGVKAMEHGMLPPTINYEIPDPECDLDYVPNVARKADVRTVMVNGFGFGGQNASLVLRKWEE
ncbi:MAG: beta-ketoacyl-ACP synthase II [Anaerolineae bacterium]|nr:beta-ketoacyl-ACP synthase II [Anaerolineae bacterium]